MSFFHSPALYTRITGGFQLQLGRAIARYNLFPFLTNQHATSKLMSVVLGSLPSDLNGSVQKATSQYQTEKSKNFLKKRLLYALTTTFSPISNLFSSAARNLGLGGGLGGVLLSGLENGEYPGGHYVLHDASWGVSIVHTSSLKGDSAWSTVLSFGSNCQSLRINIDSGSSDLLLFDQACTNCGFTNHTAFNDIDSISFKKIDNSNFNSYYADDSSVEGYLARDSVSFDGKIAIDNQIMGMATNVSDGWVALAFDGLMGIGPDSLSTFNATNNRGIFTQMIATNKLQTSVIGIALVKSSNRRDQGTFSFGALDEKWIRPDQGLVWRNVTSRNFWGLDMSGVYVNGKNAMSDSDPPRAIIDTGTSLIMVSDALASKVHSQIPGSYVDPPSGVWLVPCSISQPPQTRKSSIWPSRTTPTPNIFFEFGSGREKFGIPASDLAYEVVQGYKHNGLAMCYSGIQTGGDNFVVLGDLFLKNHYIALKYEINGQKSIGFANRTDIASLY